MPTIISQQPVSSFDLTAIGIVLVIVMAILGARWVLRVITGQSKYGDEQNLEDET